MVEVSDAGGNPRLTKKASVRGTEEENPVLLNPSYLGLHFVHIEKQRHIQFRLLFRSSCYLVRP